MAAYGDDATILQMLGPDEATAGFQSNLEDRVSAMNVVVSALVEEQTGRTWIDIPPVASARRVYQSRGQSNVLVLPTPAASITSMTVDQRDEAGVVSEGEALDESYWTVSNRNSRGEITAIRTGYWANWLGYSAITITAVWADTIEGVPADIVWAVNFITAERIKQEQASPAGFIGPDGTVAPIRDPWNDPQVKAIIARHRLTGKGLVI
jgi:hypothetical protein